MVFGTLSVGINLFCVILFVYLTSLNTLKTLERHNLLPEHANSTIFRNIGDTEDILSSNMNVESNDLEIIKTEHEFLRRKRDLKVDKLNLFKNVLKCLNLDQQSESALRKRIDVRSMEMIYPTSESKFYETVRGVFNFYSLLYKKRIIVKIERSDKVRMWWHNIKKTLIKNVGDFSCDCVPLEFHVSKSLNNTKTSVPFYDGFYLTTNDKKRIYFYELKFIDNALSLDKWFTRATNKKICLTSIQCETRLKHYFEAIYNALANIKSNKNLKLIYTDLKPDNILIDLSENRAYLIDLESVCRNNDGRWSGCVRTNDYFPKDINKTANRILTFTFAKSIYAILCKNKSTVFVYVKCETRFNDEISKSLDDFLKKYMNNKNSIFDDLIRDRWFEQTGLEEITNAFNLNVSSVKVLSDFIDDTKLKRLHPNLKTFFESKRGVFSGSYKPLGIDCIVKFEMKSNIRSWWSRSKNRTYELKKLEKNDIENKIAEPLEAYVSSKMSGQPGFLKFYQSHYLRLFGGSRLYIYFIQKIDEARDLLKWATNMTKTRGENFENKVKSFMQTIYAALNLLVEKNFVYTDLKPENILIDCTNKNNETAYLIDLESVANYDSINNYVYTIRYFPPDPDKLLNPDRILTYTFCMTIFDIICTNDLKCESTKSKGAPCTRNQISCTPRYDKITPTLVKMLNKCLKVDTSGTTKYTYKFSDISKEVWFNNKNKK